MKKKYDSIRVVSMKMAPPWWMPRWRIFQRFFSELEEDGVVELRPTTVDLTPEEIKHHKEQENENSN